MIKALAVMLFLSSLVSCQSPLGSTTPTETRTLAFDTEGYPVGNYPEQLNGTTWRLVAIHLGDEMLDVEPDQVTLSIQDGKVNGEVYCNGYYGVIDQIYKKTEAENASSGPLGIPSYHSTALGCVGDDGNVVDSDYLSYLGEVYSFERTEGQLTLFFRRYNHRLVFEPVEPSEETP